MRGRGAPVIAGVVALVVLLVFFFLFIRPRQSELGEVRDEIEAEEQREMQLQAELARLRELQARAPELQAELEEMRQFVPRRHEIANFIFLVQNAANQSGIGFLEITPQLPDVPPEGAQVAEINVTLRARGGYFAIQDFVRRLYRLDRALRIDGLALAGEEVDDVITIDATMEARIFFELPPEGAVGAPPPPAPEDEIENGDEAETPEETP